MTATRITPPVTLPSACRRGRSGPPARTSSAIVEALQQTDITRRTTYASTYFDIGGMRAVAYSAWFDWLLTALAVASRRSSDGCASPGSWFSRKDRGRWLLGLAWTAAGVAAVAGAMIGATWLSAHGARDVPPLVCEAGSVLSHAGRRRCVLQLDHGPCRPLDPGAGARVTASGGGLDVHVAALDRSRRRIGMAGAARRLLLDAATASLSACSSP